MRVAFVLPYVVESIARACVRSCKVDNLLAVDNTVTNRGIMRSQNIGIDFMRALDADWLTIMSAAVRFGPEGGQDWVRALERSAGQATVCADNVYGWHLFAFARETIEAVGRWDENFTPYGYDDNDMAIRIWKAFPQGTWGKVLVDVSDRAVGMSHSLKVGGVHSCAPDQLDYFERKWGIRPQGQPFAEFNERPFGDRDIGYWPPPTSPPVPAEYLAQVADGRWDQPCEEKLWTP